MITTRASSVPIVTAEGVRLTLRARHEIALLDVREEGAFADAHPLFAASLPIGRLEADVLDRIPRLSTRCARKLSAVRQRSPSILSKGNARLKTTCLPLSMRWSSP